MTSGRICNREVVTASRDTTVAQAARLMRQHHVGDVVVVDQRDGRLLPCGILTDRDITVSVVAKGTDPEGLSVGEVMHSALVVGHTDNAVIDIVELMQRNGVRRMPIVDAQGGLIGIVTADDIVDFVAGEMTALASMISREQEREAKSSTGSPVVIAAADDILSRLAREISALARMIAYEQQREAELRGC